MISSKKGQGALEYLLLISGAVIIAAIVVALLIGMGQSSKQGVHDNATTTAQIIQNAPFAPVLDSVTCKDDDHVILNYNLFESNQPIGSTAQVVIDGEVALDGSAIPVVPYQTPTSTEIIGICASTSHNIQIRIITNNGNYIDSNPILISN